MTGEKLKPSTRLLILVLVFILLTGVFGYGSTTTLSQKDAQDMNAQVQSIQPTTLTIFFNNVVIALQEFIPVYGVVFAVHTSYTSGIAVAAIAQSNPSTGVSGFISFLFLLLTPIYWLEFFCYSLAAEESIAIIITIIKRDIFKMEWKWIVGSIATVVVVLFVSARLEALMVNALG